MGHTHTGKKQKQLMNNNKSLSVCSPCLKYYITFPFIAHMPLIDIPMLAVCRIFPRGGGGLLPYKRLMGMCRWMGSHFHDWID